MRCCGFQDFLSGGTRREIRYPTITAEPRVLANFVAADMPEINGKPADPAEADPTWQRHFGQCDHNLFHAA